MKDHASHPLPPPLFGCADDACAAMISYPPDQIRWWGGESAGWYCDNCIDELAIDDIDPDVDWMCFVGPTLEEVLEAA